MSQTKHKKDELRIDWNEKEQFSLQSLINLICELMSTNM